MTVFTDPAEAGKLICCPAISVDGLDYEPPPLNLDLSRFVPDYEAMPRRRFWARVWWCLRGCP